MGDPERVDTIREAIDAHELIDSSSFGFFCTCQAWDAGPWRDRHEWRAHLAVEIDKALPTYEQCGWQGTFSNVLKGHQTFSTDIPVFRVVSHEEAE
jgi:hypothetical protein